MRRFGTLALLAFGLAGASIAVWKIVQNRIDPLDHLPVRDATLLSVDFQSLRRAGLLSLLHSNAASQDDEYRSFVRSTGFDYQQDLDSALVSFAPGVTYLLISGRFHWDSLQRYAIASGGSCYDDLCRMSGSTPERRISFLPLKPGLMGLAVGTDDLAAARLRDRYPRPQLTAAKDPIWLSVPSNALSRSSDLPSGTKLFALAVAGAQGVTLTLGPNGTDFAAKLEAVCNSPKDAQLMAAQLSKLTAGFQKLNATPNGVDDLTGLLVSGTFQQSGPKVFGYWPVRKSLLQNLAGGT